MGKVLPDELDLPDLSDLDDEDGRDASDALRSDEEAVGTPDAEELALADIGEGPEEVGLDAETEGEERADTLSGELLDSEDSEEGERWTSDERGIDEIEQEPDLDEDEQGWTEESEGMGGAFDEELGLDDEAAPTDDGGLEGVEDPLLDQLAVDDDDDSLLTEDEELEDDGEEDFSGDLSDAVLGRE